MKFVSCVSRTVCTEDGTHCRACRRSHEEIGEIRALTDKVAEFIRAMNYDNPEDFFAYLQKKVMKKLQQQQ